MIEEPFSTGNSIIHGLDPRVKIIVALLFSVVVATSSRFPALLSALAISLLLVAMAKLPIKRVLYRLLLVNGLIFFLWCVLPFTINGQQLFPIGPFIATKEGMLLTGQITVKSNSILLSMIALLSTTQIFALGHAMGQLRFPDKITHLFLFTFRYIHVIYKEYHKLTNAMKVRGFVPRTNMHTYKSYAYLVGMMLVRSYDRAERIHKAMLCRGFNRKYYSFTQFSLKVEDIFCLSLMLAVISGLAVLQWVVTA
jgi:cobalt/nickel transport system permease protein